MMIKFKKWISKEPVKVDHYLSFDGDGKRHAFLIDVPKTIYCENMGVQFEEGYMDPQ